MTTNNNTLDQALQFQASFVSAANLVISRTQDTWVLDFCKSLIEQVESGRNLSAKQLAIFNKNYDSIVNGTPTQPSVDQTQYLEKAKKCLTMLNEKDEWNKNFLESIISQIEKSRTLSAKQITMLEKIETEKSKPKPKIDDTMKPFRVSGKPKAKATTPDSPIPTTHIQAMGVCKKCNKEKELDFQGNLCQECDPMPF